MQFSLSSEISALGKLLDELSEMYRIYRDFHDQHAYFGRFVKCSLVFRFIGLISREDGIVSADDERVILRAILAARHRNPSIEKPCSTS